VVAVKLWSESTGSPTPYPRAGKVRPIVPNGRAFQVEPTRSTDEGWPHPAGELVASLPGRARRLKRHRPRRTSCQTIAAIPLSTSSIATSRYPRPRHRSAAMSGSVATATRRWTLSGVPLMTSVRPSGYRRIASASCGHEARGGTSDGSARQPSRSSMFSGMITPWTLIKPNQGADDDEGKAACVVEDAPAPPTGRSGSRR
jgi:hypothetical protein